MAGVNCRPLTDAAISNDGRSRADLAILIGKNRTTEILKRQRVLTLPMIRRIARPSGGRSGHLSPRA